MESAAIYSSEVHEVDSGIPMTLFKGSLGFPMYR